MAEGYITRRGSEDISSFLNFTVIGGTSKPDENNLTRNTIWVNTSDEFTSYVISNSEPQNKSVNMIWLIPALSGPIEFEPLNNGIIKICLTAAKQCKVVYPFNQHYWEDIDMQFYNGQEWITGSFYIYSYGNTYSDITNGWIISGYSCDGAGTTDGWASINTNYLYCRCRSGSSTNSQGIIGTNNKISFHNKTTMTVKGHLNNYYNGSSIMVAIVPKKSFNSSTDIKALAQITEAGDFTKEVNISSLNGEYYVCCCALAYGDAWASGVEGQLKIYEILIK